MGVNVQLTPMKEPMLAQPLPTEDPACAPDGGADFVVVVNRLPVDQVLAPDGSSTWQRSPGGLVTALEPVMHSAGGARVGWSGSAGPAPDPFTVDGLRLVPVPLSNAEVRDYYEAILHVPAGRRASCWPTTSTNPEISGGADLETLSPRVQ
jgi:hypothetical protein